jgi:hypothetical protein
MNPLEAHQIFGDVLERSRRGEVEWQLKEAKTNPQCLDFAAPAEDGAHGVEIGSEHVEDYGTVYEFRVVDETGTPLYEYGLSFHATDEGNGGTYQEFVELFSLAREHASAKEDRGR